MSTLFARTHRSAQGPYLVVEAPNFFMAVLQKDATSIAATLQQRAKESRAKAAAYIKRAERLEAAAQIVLATSL